MSGSMDKILASVQTLPSIPKALQEIMMTLNREDSGPIDICDPLSTDPVLTAKVLRMSNCAHFGHTRQIATVEEAVLMVGMNAVRTMVIASGLMGSFSDIPGFDMRRFWQISLLSGSLAREMAAHVEVSREAAYTAALMHGLGVLAMHSAFPTESAQVDKVCQEISPLGRAECEFEHLGFHHGDVGAEIAQRWHLPDEIANAIRYYAYPRRNGALDMAVVVHCAVALAIDLLDGTEAELWGQEIHPVLVNRLHLDWEKLRANKERLMKYLDATHEMVS